MLFEKLIVFILRVYFLINFLIIFLIFLYYIYMISNIPLKFIRKNIKTNIIVSSKILKYEYLTKGNIINELII